MSELATALLLAAAVALGWLRLGVWQARAPVRSRWWRVALLAAGQGVAGVLLFLTLFPPPATREAAATLTVATRGASGVGAVALPEARGGGERAPDLATALRRHPGVRRLRVRGEGLEARDRAAARGLAIEFAPPTPPRGLVALASPARVAPGAAFRVGGEASGLAGGTVELLDPAGARADLRPIGDGPFTLDGSARVAGVALWRLRLRDAAGTLVEDADAPVVTAADTPVRALLLAGAPGPEVKFWRRWAADAGLSVTERESVGAGLTLGDPAPPISAASLSRYDLAVLDDRSWSALGVGERAGFAAAVRGGLGLVLRATAPLPAGVRSGWAAFGLPVVAGEATAPVRLDPDAPVLTRRAALGASGALATIGGDGAAAWRAVGRGRVALWTLQDDHALVTSGHGARYGELWAATVAAVARAKPATPEPQLDPLPLTGERMRVCAPAGASIAAPDGRVTTPLPDSAANGCAGIWPRVAGWHTLRWSGGSRPFYVFAADALPALRAAERRDATLRLAWSSAEAAGPSAERRPGSPWPWFAGLLLALALLWRFERVAMGRGSA